MNELLKRLMEPLLDEMFRVISRRDDEGRTIIPNLPAMIGRWFEAPEERDTWRQGAYNGIDAMIIRQDEGAFAVGAALWAYVVWLDFVEEDFYTFLSLRDRVDHWAAQH